MEPPKLPAKKMQSVKFTSVEDFLAYLPPEELRVVEYLRELIVECIPEATERLSYNVPYYKRRRNICFIWPASVLWGSKQTWDGVRLGFTTGYLLTDAEGYLDQGHRKQVYWKDFQHIQQIDADRVRALLYEAVLIDAQNGL